jgi:hypothetical protein
MNGSRFPFEIRSTPSSASIPNSGCRLPTSMSFTSVVALMAFRETPECLPVPE